MFHACQIQPQNPVCCRRAAGLGRCASAVAPNEQIELTRSAVNRAVSADATQYTGSDALNQQLSERRAAAVGNALRRQSVSADRIVTAGYGKEYPVATNADAQSRQLNRRVEVIISRDAQAVAPRY